jgi:hypothetical protein
MNPEQILAETKGMHSYEDSTLLWKDENPNRAGFVICVGEKPLKNPYF